MISLAEAIIWQNYLNPNSDGLMSEVDSFPDIRYLTGNYYVGDTSCGYVYRDKNIRTIGRLQHKHRNGKEWTEKWLPRYFPRKRHGGLRSIKRQGEPLWFTLPLTSL